MAGSYATSNAHPPRELGRSGALRVEAAYMIRLLLMHPLKPFIFGNERTDAGAFVVKWLRSIPAERLPLAEMCAPFDSVSEKPESAERADLLSVRSS